MGWTKNGRFLCLQTGYSFGCVLAHQMACQLSQAWLVYAKLESSTDRSHRSLYLPVLHPWAKLCQDGLDVLLILCDLEVLRGFIEWKQTRVITSQGWRFSCTDQIRMANHDVDCNVVNWFLRYLYVYDNLDPSRRLPKLNRIFTRIWYYIDQILYDPL